MGVEEQIRPAMLDLIRGRRPSSGEWNSEMVRNKAMSPEIRREGTLKCSSHNWPPMYGMVALGMHLMHGDDSFDWTVDWWRNYFAEARDRWFMHREFGSTIYRTWIRDSIDGVRFVSSGRHPELHRLASDWLRAYWYLEFLAASPAVSVTRYVDPGTRFVAPATNLCGGRSWSIKGGQDFPKHIDLHLSSALAAHLRGRPVPNWVRQGDTWEIFTTAGASGMKGDDVLEGLEKGRRSAAETAVRHLAPYGAVAGGHAFRWADGTAAFALDSNQGLSGATAILDAMTTDADGKRRVLYHDSGARGAGTITKAKVEVDVAASGRVVVTVERDGVRDLRTRSPEVDEKDAGLFEHPSADRRRLVLHEGGSELLWHVKIDQNGTRFAEAAPTPSPPPTPPPSTGDDGVRRRVAEARNAAKDAGRRDDAHALAITTLMLDAVEGGHAPDSTEWKKLRDKAEDHARAWTG